MPALPFLPDGIDWGVLALLIAAAFAAGGGLARPGLALGGWV